MDCEKCQVSVRDAVVITTGSFKTVLAIWLAIEPTPIIHHHHHHQQQQQWQQPPSIQSSITLTSDPINNQQRSPLPPWNLQPLHQGLIRRDIRQGHTSRLHEIQALRLEGHTPRIHEPKLSITTLPNWTTREENYIAGFEVRDIGAGGFDGAYAVETADLDGAGRGHRV